VTLQFGGQRDLSALATCPQLSDVELWRVAKLEAGDLRAVAAIPRLEALALGGLRNVSSLDWLAPGSHRLRYLSLEKLPTLESYAPLAECRQLAAFGSWDSRPADRRLRPLHGLPLRDLVLGDVYPPDEVQALLQRCPGRARIRTTTRGAEPKLRWRGLFEYVDEVRHG
jgi:hypothetical protein